MSNFKLTSPKVFNIPERSPSLSHQSSSSSIHPPHSTHVNHGHAHSNSLSSSNTSSRKPSIVELLSSPPPLPQNSSNNEDINSFSLSRNNSASSRASLELFDIQLSELIEKNKLISINSSYSIQHAFETLVKHDLTSVPVSLSKDNTGSLSNCLTFDYSDLNTYLLLIMNKIGLSDLNHDFEGFSKEIFDTLVAKAKKGEEVPVDFIIKLHPKNPFIKINETETLLPVMEILGNGVHRIAITTATNPSEIIGILSQRRLIKFIWDNARRFQNLEYYFNSSIEELKIGSNNPITIYEDQPVIEALYKMFKERISSLAAIDRKGFLVGNISIVDVQNLTSSQKSHLLFKSVMNFISYNLSQKGIEEGKDQFPIFHVNKYTGLGRIIAKLVATQSHRLWVVESLGSSVSSSGSGGFALEDTLNLLNSEYTSKPGKPGKLVGVVTLTDIIGFLASIKSNGRIDPQFARNQRRRSSTSTRSSLDNSSSLEIFRK